MITYYIRPGGAFVKINDTTKVVDLVLNISTQQTLSTIYNNDDYFNSTVSASIASGSGWIATDQTTYDTNFNSVLQFLSNQ